MFKTEYKSAIVFIGIVTKLTKKLPNLSQYEYILILCIFHIHETIYCLSTILQNVNIFRLYMYIIIICHLCSNILTFLRLWYGMKAKTLTRTLPARHMCILIIWTTIPHMGEALTLLSLSPLPRPRTRSP